MGSKPRDRYIFYKDRPEWADITPVPQDEDGRNIVRIAYSAQFVDANDYLRAVLLKDERSERALAVTTTVLLLNPANYTVWEYRRRILETLSADLNEELEFLDHLIAEHSKNYQLWHHRQWVVDKLSTQHHSGKETASELCESAELDFTDTVISDDSKNYHAWQYRRWVVTRFHMPVAGELRYTESLIREDVYNNSAWNHRFTTVTQDEGLTPPVLEREIEFTQNMIRQAPNNESAWNYLYGLLVPPPSVLSGCTQASTVCDLPAFSTHVTMVTETAPASDLTASSEAGTAQLMANQEVLPTNLQRMRKFAEDLASTDSVASNSVALLGFLVEVYTDCLQARMREKSCPSQSSAQGKDLPTGHNANVVGSDHPDKSESLSELLELAISTCDRLATEVDRIRVNYWHYRARQLVALGEEIGLRV